MIFDGDDDNNGNGENGEAPADPGDQNLGDDLTKAGEGHDTVEDTVL